MREAYLSGTPCSPCPTSWPWASCWTSSRWRRIRPWRIWKLFSKEMMKNGWPFWRKLSSSPRESKRTHCLISGPTVKWFHTISWGGGGSSVVTLGIRIVDGWQNVWSSIDSENFCPDFEWQSINLSFYQISKVQKYEHAFYYENIWCEGQIITYNDSSIPLPPPPTTHNLLIFFIFIMFGKFLPFRKLMSLQKAEICGQLTNWQT